MSKWVGKENKTKTKHHLDCTGDGWEGNDWEGEESKIRETDEVRGRGEKERGNLFRKATLLMEIKLKGILHSPPSLTSVASLGIRDRRGQACCQLRAAHCVSGGHTKTHHSS